MPEAIADSVQMHRSMVRLIRGDITEVDVDAFVFYAQHDLALGSGFGTVISVRGGPSIQKELDEIRPIETGQAVVTGAGKLQADFIIHAVGPRFQEEDTEGKLRTTVLNSLKAAEEKGVQRIALPAMGAGFYGVPIETSAEVTVDSVNKYLQNAGNIQEVFLCMLDSKQYKAFQERLAKLA